MISGRVFRGLSKNKLAVRMAERHSKGPKKATSKSPLSFVDAIRKDHGDAMTRLDQSIEELTVQSQETSSSSSNSLVSVISSRCLREGVRLLPIGSTVSGMSNISSDVDLAFFPVDSLERSQFLRAFHSNPDFKQNFLSSFAGMIARHAKEAGKQVEETSVLHRLKVPLLSISFTDGTAMDINFPDENYQALRNTNLVRCYNLTDARFYKMFYWLRRLCDALEVRHSKIGLLSSYHLLNLIIHFLQSEQCLSPWPVLPVLCKTHPELVAPNLPIEQIVGQLDLPLGQQKIEWTSNNRMAVSELAIRFVDYYANFNIAHTAIFIEKGLSSRRKQAVGDIRLQIFDPYSRITVARSNHAAAAFSSAMNFTRRKMRNGLMLDSFPEFPESTLFLSETRWADWRSHLEDKKTDERNEEEVDEVKAL